MSSRSRRTIVPLIAAGAVGLTVGCSSPAPQTTGTETAGSTIEVIEMTPAASGELDSLTWAVNAEPSSFDWIYNASQATGTIMANVCEGLMRLDTDMSVVPALAESVATPDDTTLVYTLREGVSFHDGTPLTAADVAFSLKRNMDGSLGSFWSGAYANVASIEATGPLEVTVSLTQPDVLFNAYMSSPAGIVDSEATVTSLGEDYGTPSGGVNCVGPYKLADWNSGQSMTLERDDEYFDASRRAQTEIVEFVFVRDPATLVSGLLAGSIDGTWGLDPSAIETLAASEAGTVYYGPSTRGFNAIVMDMEGPLGDPAVRQALSMAISRSDIIEVVVGGAATEQRAPAVPGSWGYSVDIFQAGWDDLAVTTQNIEAAEEVLATTTIPSEPIVIATTSNDAVIPVIGAEFQSAARQIGLDVEVQVIPADQYSAVYTDPEARKGIDLYLTGWGTDFPEPLQMYRYFTTGDFYNFSGFSDPTYDGLIADAAQESDEAARAELIVEAQKIVVEEMLWIPLYAPHNTLFLSERITGSPASYVQLHYPWAALLGASE